MTDINPIAIKAVVEARSKDVASVANNLLSKISGAIGTVYEPVHVKRMAKARAKAQEVGVESELRTEAQRRAFQRLLYEEERKQQNMDAVTAGAIEFLNAEAQPEKVEDDWITEFFERARKVSDEEMQTLWSKILAGESNAPGSFSKSTLSIVSLLDKEDANAFVSICRFSIMLGQLTPVIFDLQADIYEKNNVSFIQTSHLEDIGLISFENLTGYQKQGLPNQFRMAYGPIVLQVKLPEGKNDIAFGHVIFTKIGAQLAPLTNAHVVPEFIPYVIEEWKKQNVVVAVVTP